MDSGECASVTDICMQLHHDGGHLSRILLLLAYDFADSHPGLTRSCQNNRLTLSRLETVSLSPRHRNGAMESLARHGPALSRAGEVQ